MSRSGTTRSVPTSVGKGDPLAEQGFLQKTYDDLDQTMRSAIRLSRAIEEAQGKVFNEITADDDQDKGESDRPVANAESISTLLGQLLSQNKSNEAALERFVSKF